MMDELHDSLNDVYESLVDKEYSDARKNISNLKCKLDDVSKTIEDEF